MAAAPAEFKIDGIWVQCLPTDDFGSLGPRYLCDLAKAPGEPAKLILLRLKDWPQAGMPPYVEPAHLVLKLAPDAGSAAYRPVKGKLYQRTAQGTVGKSGIESCSVFQQDISGLMSLRQAVLRAKTSGDSRQIWRLFYASCKALNHFGKKISGPGQPIPLQCPASLAVGADGAIVLLDAEIRISVDAATTPEARQLFQTWFGEKGAGGQAHAGDASLLHSRALLLFFRQLLGSVPARAAGAVSPALNVVLNGLAQAPDGLPLDDLEDWIRTNGEDWNLPVDDEEMESKEEPAPLPSVEFVPVEKARLTKKRRSALLAFSGCLNFLLTAAVLALLVLLGLQAFPWKSKADTADQIDSAVLFSSYCVVFPTQGTIGEKVNLTLSDLFPGKVKEIKRVPGERDRLLDEKMKAVVLGLPEPEKLKQLLERLAADNAIHFKGFSPGSAEGLTAIIERGGVFSISGNKEEHGSLLQSTSLDKILTRANPTDATEAHKLLGQLRMAVADYASLKDALSIIGDRSAFLVAVEPTAAGHDATRKKLLSRLDKPVFSSRPIPGLFDAVDPTSDTGGGSALYTLRLERPCYWRAASKDDRKEVVFDKNTTNDRMKWLSVPEGRVIEWQPLPLRKKNGKTEPTAAFDIAVVRNDKVIVFRNQNIQLGDTRQRVVDAARDYINEGLKLGVGEIEERVTLRQQDRQVAGALNYSYLADLVKESGGDLEIHSKEQFEQLKMREDDF